MVNGEATSDINLEVPSEILSNPALLFLYYRIEQILGIKAGSAALVNLNKYMEEKCGASFIENPALYEHLLTSREQIYEISKFLTVNETYFFRESAHFNLLENLLPEFLKISRPLQICSAASSIGCEAYSIAMLLDHHIQKGLKIDFTVDAFDVNGESIETAKIARYTANTIRTDGSSWKYIIDSYLINDNNEFIISENIRRKVNFFPHNIMRGLEKQYDIIFYRNALIYFSSRSRLSVMNNLSDALFNNGLLFLGASETASIKHPLLVNKFLSDVFYFQKIEISNFEKQVYASFEPNKKDVSSGIKPIDKHIEHKKPAEKSSLPSKINTLKISFNCAEISKILKTDEGKPNAENVLKTIITGDASVSLPAQTLCGSGIAASAIYFLNSQDYNIADKIITYLEKNNSGAFTRFLRGEYYFHTGNFEEAERNYHEASVKDKMFWPAFYRISIIAAEGNKTRYEYKIKRAIESIETYQSRETEKKINYECFIGGFSPDYFLRILEKKLT
ncbi:MAG: hypothetical protein FWC22_03760 [Treponema sp.]|nr:hypothetical protein [Treponema sp.]